MSLKDAPADKRVIPDRYAVYFSKAEDIADFRIRGCNIAPTGKVCFSREAMEDYILRNGGNVVGHISVTNSMLTSRLEGKYAEKENRDIDGRTNGKA